MACSAVTGRCHGACVVGICGNLIDGLDLALFRSCMSINQQSSTYRNLSDLLEVENIWHALHNAIPNSGAYFDNYRRLQPIHLV
jgi:hypothetical protein